MPQAVGEQTLGTTDAKRGNVHLKWAFSEAAVLFLRHTKDGKRLLAAIEKKHGKGKGLSILAHKIGRAVFYMLSRRTVFSTEKFLATEAGRERASQTSNSSHVTELAQIAECACAASATSRRSQALPSPSLVTTVTRRRRRSS